MPSRHIDLSAKDLNKSTELTPFSQFSSSYPGIIVDELSWMLLRCCLFVSELDWPLIFFSQSIVQDHPRSKDILQH